MLPGVELLLEEELDGFRAEPLLDLELPWVAARATPPPPIKADVATAVARVVRLNTGTSFHRFARSIQPALVGSGVSTG